MFEIRFAKSIFGYVLVVLLALTAHVGQAQGTTHDLAFYLEQARQNSPLSRDIQAQGQAVQLETERLRALYTKLQGTLTGNYVATPVLAHDNGHTTLRYSAESTTHYSGYDMALSNGALYQGLAQLTQPLFNQPRFEAYAKQAQTTALVQQNVAGLSLHDLEKLVGDQYILCRQDLQQLDYIRETLGILDKQRLLVRKLVEASLLKQSDYTLLTVEYQTQQLALNTFHTAYHRDLLDLNVLCGLGDTTEALLPEPNLTLQRTPVTLSRYTERYRLDSLNLAATQQVFELRYRPVVSAFVNGGLNAVSFQDISSRFGSSVGLSFSVFLFDGHQRQLSRDRTTVLLRSVQYARENFQKVNPVRQQRLLYELRALEQRQKLAREQVASYRSLLDSYKREVIAGQLPVINYVTVLKSFATVTRDLVLLENNRLLLINAYNYWNW